MSSPGGEGAFYSHFRMLLLVGAASAFGAAGIRVGTDPLREEFAKFRETITRLFDDHERRLVSHSAEIRGLDLRTTALEHNGKRQRQ
jgi:hypothetical protein